LAARRIERLRLLEEKFKNTEILSIKTDVSVEEDCKNLIEQAVERFGKIDVLINNAGISMRAIFENVELSVLRRMMDVNYWGTVCCSKYALPYLLESKGSLVGVISIGGYVGLPGRTGYSASKFAIRGFLDTVRTENLKTGLHVLVAAPGFTASEIRMNALTTKGGIQGETPRNENKMMSAEKVAEKIYRAVQKRRRRLILTFIEGKATVFISKIWAQLVDVSMYKIFASEPDSPLR